METSVSAGRVSRKYWRAKETVDFDFLTASFPPAPVNCHFHHGFTISVVEAGVLPFVFRDFHLNLRPGEVLLLGPEVPHGFDGACRADGGRYRTLTRTLCNLPPPLAQILVRELNSACMIADDSLWSVFLELLQDAEGGTLRNVRLLYELSRELLSGISKNVLFKFDVKSPSIRAVKAYIDRNYARVPNIGELSREGSLSPRHFARSFKDEIGMTPHGYLNQRRINKARELLGMGRPMTNIAYDLGFSDQSHFSKTFSKITGVSPARYRAGIVTNAR